MRINQFEKPLTIIINFGDAANERTKYINAIVSTSETQRELKERSKMLPEKERGERK